MRINDKIKQARALKGWSQQKIANEIGEKRSTYAEWENATMPTFDIVVQISSVTGMPLIEFIKAVDGNLSEDVVLDEKASPLMDGQKLNDVNYLKGKLDGKDEVIAQVEARRKDYELWSAKYEKREQDYVDIIKGHLGLLLTNSKNIANDLSALTIQMQAGHRAMMDSIDVAAGLPTGTTAAAADTVELASEEMLQNKGKNKHESRKNKQ